MNDTEYERQCINNVMNALDSNDSSEIITLFSSNALKQINDVNFDVLSLFEYYKGDFLSYFSEGAQVSEHFSERKLSKTLLISCDIVTNEQDYRIAMKYCVVDDFDKGNVGLWSLYIIKKEDDTDLDYWYSGDGKYTAGINIGIKNVIDWIS